MSKTYDTNADAYSFIEILIFIYKWSNEVIQLHLQQIIKKQLTLTNKINK